MKQGLFFFTAMIVIIITGTVLGKLLFDYVNRPVVFWSTSKDVCEKVLSPSNEFTCSDVDNKLQSYSKVYVK